MKKLIFLYFLLNVIHDGFGHYVGKHDEKICHLSTLSCNYQLDPAVRKLVQCDIEYIEAKDCPECYIEKVFEPATLPFNIELYKIDNNEIAPSVFLNISFLSPKWKALTFLLQNQNAPQTKLCRKFSLSRNTTLEIDKALYWSCYTFSDEQMEGNFYDLYLQDEEFNGGIYSFKVPEINNYDINLKSEATWHVFFFIHYQYLKISGKLVITLQPAPFANISYAVSLVRCLDEIQECKERIELHTVHIFQPKISLTAKPQTIELKTVTIPGYFAVTVQILSPNCSQGKCDRSFSPIFQWPRTYMAEIIVCYSAFVIIITLSVFLIIRRLHSDLNKYIQEKSLKNDHVMFVYLADSEEMFLLFNFLADVFQKKLYVVPMLVENEVGSEDPNTWTRYHLCHASRVLFFIPKDPNSQSCTPIQHQWQCAITYFSGVCMKDKSILSRCATVTLPNSQSILQGDKIYGLKRFNLEEDLVSLVNWLHRDKFFDELLYWRFVTRGISKQVSVFIRFAIDPQNNSLRDYHIRAKGLERSSSDTTDSLVCIPEITKISLPDIEESSAQKTDQAFDPMIPDVHEIESIPAKEDSDTDENELDPESGEDLYTFNNVLNFAI